MVSTTAASLSMPETIGKYQVEGVLGRGAMGVVYKGYDPYIKRYVAIKTIHNKLLDTEIGDELLARFSKEAEAVGRLTHPNIVSIYDFDRCETGPYFVMEFVEGVELKSMMSSSRPMPLEKGVSILCGVLEGLAYTHKLGIVHRDIKPANIFVLDDGGVKIADFGIARLDNSDYTQIGQVLGTPNYMSPEQCQGALLDERSDLFSLALVFFEMVVGEKAFQGRNAQETMRKVVQERAPSPTTRNTHLPIAVDRFLNKALAKQPADRFQSAEEFEAELLRLAPLLRRPSMGPGLEGLKSKARKALAVMGYGLATLCMAFLVWQFWQLERPESGAVSPPNERTLAEPSVAETTLLTAIQQEKVMRLLRVAKAHLLVQRLVAPQGSNAFDAYQLVLSIDPTNQEALSGLQVVEEKLALRVSALQHEGKVQEARSYIQLGQKLFPKSERWDMFR